MIFLKAKQLARIFCIEILLFLMFSSILMSTFSLTSYQTQNTQSLTYAQSTENISVTNAGNLLILSDFNLTNSPLVIDSNESIYNMNLGEKKELTFNFSILSAQDSWKETSIEIHGPYGGIENGGRLTLANNRVTNVTRTITFWTGDVTGFTWLKISGTTQKGNQIIKYLLINITAPQNESNSNNEVAYFEVGPKNAKLSEQGYFLIKLTDSDKISTARTILKNNEKKIVTGVVAFSWGGFNVDLQNKRLWTWHLASKSVQFADFTVELCDGTPQFVEENVFEWIHSQTRFCPWSWTLIREVTTQEIQNLLKQDTKPPQVTTFTNSTDKNEITYKLTANDNLGVINATLFITTPNQTSHSLQMQPQGNGIFTLSLPHSQISLIENLSFMVFDANNHFTTLITEHTPTNLLPPIITLALITTGLGAIGATLWWIKRLYKKPSIEIKSLKKKHD